MLHPLDEATRQKVSAKTIFLKKFKKPTKEDITKLINSAIKTINDKLPNFKHIKNYVIKEDELEKTTTQKVKRFGNNIEELKNRLKNKRKK